MSLSNPFEKLNIKRDIEEEDDDQGEFQKVKGKEKNLPVGIEKKKRKTRPKENVEANDEEGFEEVGNKAKKKRPVNDEEDEGFQGGEHKKRKGINYGTAEKSDYRTKDKPKRGRQFDRQSGTGRGKEIAKGGAGGKGTWGENPKAIAREYEDNNDDYYFENALNPEKAKERKERPPRRARKEDKKEGEEGEENKGEDKGEKKEEQEDNKKRKERPKYELKEEEKLNRPKDAKTLEEYLKEKEKPVEEEKKEVKRINDGKPLEKKQEKNDDILGTTGEGRKKGKKKKYKEINKEESDLNNLIGSNLQIGGGETMGRRPRRVKKDKRGEGKFVFKEEDFPEL